MSLSRLTFSEQRSEPKKKDGVANTATLPNEKGKAREVRAAPGSRILLGDRVRVRYALFYMDEGGNFVFHSDQLIPITITVGDDTSLFGQSHRLLGSELGKTQSFIVKEGEETWKYRVRILNTVEQDV
ncbi:hypothetical protein EYR40_008734 [Pleurotus pulmonarius]|nr:hypothetical protein EYR36_003590 [Pleurotus pulmonarius]KAF4569756.1 hypothetical protein EYR36_009556 [Pleurotus pulmonarius]KAF4593937.1 hypothetical protein EYR40_008734 [Pleurotus pulmonarius]